MVLLDWGLYSRRSVTGLEEGHEALVAWLKANLKHPNDILWKRRGHFSLFFSVKVGR